MCSKEGRRILLWMCWVVTMLITTLYYVLSLATAYNLIRSYRQLDIPISNEIWRAPVAAAVLGGLLTLLCNVLSCAVLAKKTSDKRGGGFGFGFIAAMCASLAFFALLCGLVLDGFKDGVRSELQVKLRDTWPELSSGVYVATIAFAYLSFVVLLLFFVALILFQSGVSEEVLHTIGGGGGSSNNTAIPLATPSSPSPLLRNPFAKSSIYAPASPFAEGSSSPNSRIPAVHAMPTPLPTPPPPQRGAGGMLQMQPPPAPQAPPSAGGPFASAMMQQDSAI